MIRQATRERPAQLPLALPHVEVTIPDDGPITISVDGVRLESRTPIERATLRPRLLELARQRSEALQVRIREGGRPPFVDIIRPDDAMPSPAADPLETTAPDTLDEAEALAPADNPDDPAPSDPLPFRVDDDGVVVGLTGDGFLPGEHVAFAVIVTRHTADDDGTASLRLPTALLARRPGPFVLFGQTSGTLVLADPFGGDER